MGGWSRTEPEEREQKSLGEVVSDIVELLKAYAKQETLGPLKRLGRYLGFGIGGSVLIATGLVFLMLTGLRVLQVETGSTFTGSWSWAPYRDRARGEPCSRGAVPQLHADPEGRPEMSAAAPAPQITRADIEAKFRELQGGATKKAEATGATAIKVAVGVLAVIVVGVVHHGTPEGPSPDDDRRDPSGLRWPA